MHRVLTLNNIAVEGLQQFRGDITKWVPTSAMLTRF